MNNRWRCWWGWPPRLHQWTHWKITKERRTLSFAGQFNPDYLDGALVERGSRYCRRCKAYKFYENCTFSPAPK